MKIGRPGKTKEEFIKIAKEKLDMLGVHDVEGFVNFETSCLFHSSNGTFKTSPSNFIKNLKLGKPVYLDKLEHSKRVLSETNTQYKNGDISILLVGKTIHDKMYVQDKYGVCAVRLNNLRKDTKVSIKSAVNRVEYFKNQVYETNEHYRNGTFEILEYCGDGRYLIKNKYGLLNVIDFILLSGENPGILSAVNKTEFTINKFKEVHGGLFDYSKFEYIGNKTKSTIICKKHGEFYQSPGQHLVSGCNECRLETDWWRKSVLKELVDKKGSGILYFLEVYNCSEKFLKIGYTTRSVNKRYISLKKKYGYDYTIIREYVTSDGEELFNLENSLKVRYRDFRYTPQNPFEGSMTEVFNYSQYENILKEFDELITQ